MRSNLLKRGMEMAVLSEIDALKLYFWFCKTGLQTAISVALALTFIEFWYFDSESCFCGGNSLLFHGL